MDKDNKPLHIVSYITKASSKCMAQKVPKRVSQLDFKGSEVNVKPNTSENLLDNQNSRNLIVDTNSLAGLENALPEEHSPDPKKRAFCKCKQSVYDLGVTNRRSKKSGLRQNFQG